MGAPSERQMAQPVGPPIPFAWAAQTPRDEELLLADLRRWVVWLVERYPLDHRTVPDCWPQHAELIEELSALHLAWEGAFATTAPPDAPLQWHERFATARQRLAEWVSRTGCRPGSHREPSAGRRAGGSSCPASR
jgi:hypothetical protein